MKSVWRLPFEELPRSQIAQRRIELVLVEHDGPQIVALRGPDGERWLSVACDEDAAAVRWLEAPLTSAEWGELVEGRLAVRDALLRRGTLCVIDETRAGEPLRGWRLAATHLDEDVLPEPGALLPAETRGWSASELRATSSGLG